MRSVGADGTAFFYKKKRTMEELKKELLITIIEANNILISGLKNELVTGELKEFIDRQVVNNNNAIESLR